MKPYSNKQRKAPNVPGHSNLAERKKRMRRSYRRSVKSALKAGILIMGVLLFLTGCASANLDIVVNADDSVRAAGSLTVPSQLLTLAEAKADEDGILDQLRSVSDGDLVITNEGDNTKISFTASGTIDNPPLPGALRITKTGGQYYFSWLVNGTDNAAGRLIAMNVSATMPGKITASNADEVAGHTAHWHFTGDRVEALTMQANAPSVPSFFWPIILSSLAALILVVANKVLPRPTDYTKTHA